MLEALYEQLLTLITREPEVTHAGWRHYAGQRFLYVTTPLAEPVVTDRLVKAGQQLVHGTRIQVECVYVRSAPLLHVFRFRFTVPNEKQFCCGNLCPDCLRLRQV